MYLNDKRHTRRKTKKRWGWLNCGFEISKKWKGKQEKDGCCRVVYLKCRRFANEKRDKKDGISQVVDLKLTKKLKGKWEKKDGFCRVVDLNLQRNKRIWKVPKKEKEEKKKNFLST